MNKISENKVKELIKELNGLSSLKDSKRKLQYWYNQKQNIVNSENISTDLIKEFLDAYSKVKRNCKFVTEESIDTDDRAITKLERDEDGNIIYYVFEIFKKNRPPLAGKLDCKEMETIYSLYSTYGANLTSKIVSREFPEYSFVDFKRILKAFNIYKYDLAPQHILENLNEEQIIERQNRIKENNVLRKIEKDQLSEANKLIIKLAKENQELKNNFKDIHIVEDVEIKPFKIKEKYTTHNDLMLHLSDIHTGSCLTSGNLFDNPWDEEELERRLNKIVDLIGNNFGILDTIVINMLGDYLDGMDNQTARRDHFMPQNMDNRQQFNVFIRQMLSFIGNLSNYCSKIIIYAVPEGNHGGSADYMAIKALEYASKRKFPGIEFTVFERFFGYYKFNSETYLIMHGKYKFKYLF